MPKTRYEEEYTQRKTQAVERVLSYVEDGVKRIEPISVELSQTRYPSAIHPIRRHSYERGLEYVKAQMQEGLQREHTKSENYQALEASVASIQAMAEYVYTTIEGEETQTPKAESSQIQNLRKLAKSFRELAVQQNALLLQLSNIEKEEAVLSDMGAEQVAAGTRGVMHSRSDMEAVLLDIRDNQEQVRRRVQQEAETFSEITRKIVEGIALSDEETVFLSGKGMQIHTTGFQEVAQVESAKREKIESEEREKIGEAKKKFANLAKRMETALNPEIGYIETPVEVMAELEQQVATTDNPYEKEILAQIKQEAEEKSKETAQALSQHPVLTLQGKLERADLMELKQGVEEIYAMAESQLLSGESEQIHEKLDEMILSHAQNMAQEFAPKPKDGETLSSEQADEMKAAIPVYARMAQACRLDWRLMQKLETLSPKEYIDLANQLQNTESEDKRIAVNKKIEELFAGDKTIDSAVMDLQVAILEGKMTGDNPTSLSESMGNQLEPMRNKIGAQFALNRLMPQLRTAAAKTKQMFDSSYNKIVDDLDKLSDKRFIEQLLKNSDKLTADERYALIRAYVLEDIVETGKKKSAKVLSDQLKSIGSDIQPEEVSNALIFETKDRSEAAIKGAKTASEIWDSKTLGNRFWNYMGNLVGRDMSNERLGWRTVEAILAPPDHSNARLIMEGLVREATKKSDKGGAITTHAIVQSEDTNTPILVQRQDVGTSSFVRLMLENIEKSRFGVEPAVAFLRAGDMAKLRFRRNLSETIAPVSELLVEARKKEIEPSPVVALHYLCLEEMLKRGGNCHTYEEMQTQIQSLDFLTNSFSVDMNPLYMTNEHMESNDEHMERNDKQSKEAMNKFAEMMGNLNGLTKVKTQELSEKQRRDFLMMYQELCRQCYDGLQNAFGIEESKKYNFQDRAIVILSENDLSQTLDKGICDASGKKKSLEDLGLTEFVTELREQVQSTFLTTGKKMLYDAQKENITPSPVVAIRYQCFEELIRRGEKCQTYEDMQTQIEQIKKLRRMFSENTNLFYMTDSEMELKGTSEEQEKQNSAKQWFQEQMSKVDRMTIDVSNSSLSEDEKKTRVKEFQALCRELRQKSQDVDYHGEKYEFWDRAGNVVSHADLYETFQETIVAALGSETAEQELGLEKFVEMQVRPLAGCERLVNGNPYQKLPKEIQKMVMTVAKVSVMYSFTQQNPPIEFEEYIERLGDKYSKEYQTVFWSFGDAMKDMKYPDPNHPDKWIFPGASMRGTSIADMMLTTFVEEVQKAESAKKWLEDNALNYQLLDPKVLAEQLGVSQEAAEEIGNQYKQEKINHMVDGIKKRQCCSIVHTNGGEVGVTAKATGDISIQVALGLTKENELLLYKDAKGHCSVILGKKLAGTIGTILDIDVAGIVNVEASAKAGIGAFGGMKVDFDTDEQMKHFMHTIMAADDRSIGEAFMDGASIHIIQEIGGKIELGAKVELGEKTKKAIGQVQTVYDAIRSEEREEDNPMIDVSAEAQAYVAGSIRTEQKDSDHKVVTASLTAGAMARTTLHLGIGSSKDGDHSLEADVSISGEVKQFITGDTVTGIETSRNYVIKTMEKGETPEADEQMKRQRILLVAQILNNHGISNDTMLKDLAEKPLEEEIAFTVTSRMREDAVRLYNEASGLNKVVAFMTTDEANYKATSITVNISGEHVAEGGEVQKTKELKEAESEEKSGEKKEEKKGVTGIRVKFSRQAAASITETIEYHTAPPKPVEESRIQKLITKTPESETKQEQEQTDNFKVTKPELQTYSGGSSKAIKPESQISTIEHTQKSVTIPSSNQDIEQLLESCDFSKTEDVMKHFDKIVKIASFDISQVNLKGATPEQVENYNNRAAMAESFRPLIEIHTAGSQVGYEGITDREKLETFATDFVCALQSAKEGVDAYVQNKKAQGITSIGKTGARNHITLEILVADEKKAKGQTVKDSHAQRPQKQAETTKSASPSKKAPTHKS